MDRPRQLGATILAVFFTLILGGLLLSGILEQRESKKLNASWEISRRAQLRGRDDNDFAVGFHLGHSSLYEWTSTVSLLNVIAHMMSPGRLSLGFEMEQP